MNQSCVFSGDSELDRMSSGWISSPSLSKFGSSYPQGFQTCPFSADDQCIISDTEDNLQKAVYSLYNKSKEFNLEIATNKTKVFGFVGTDHLRAKIIINDEILEQVNQFTYLGCSLLCQCSNDVELN